MLLTYPVLDARKDAPQFADETVGQGVQLIEELFKVWGGQDQESDGDVTIEDDATVEAQLAELRQLVEQFRPRIEENPWLQHILAAL